MNGLPLFNIPESPAKRVAETSRESYAEVKVTLGARQLTVLRHLARYVNTFCSEPTSSELMRSMGISDPNSVRPRLTELKELRFVEASERPRKCMVTGKSVSTWKVSPRGELYLRDKK